MPENNTEQRKRVRPGWAIRCNTALDEKGMTKRQLAEAIHVHFTRISRAMSGNPKYIDENVAQSICTYLGVKYE